MLLRHTAADAPEREALTVNPAKTCQPIGAMYAALGIHGCLPHSHGSQGCCSYHRSALTRHYKEPVFAATSSFTEGTSVFGGQANLMAAIETIFSAYDPEVIAIHTTCLSETIGDDLVQISTKARMEGKVPEGKEIIFANTPSYVGSHVIGFANMVKGMVTAFGSASEERSERLNIIPGWVEPADMREIKSLCATMQIPISMFPDTSGVLDCGLDGSTGIFPAGGTTVAELKTMGAAKHTVALGPTASGPAARELEVQAQVTSDVLEIPYGLRATDRFIDKLRTIAGVEVPAEITWQRQRLVDLISDMHQYFYGKRVALWGDPDQLVSLTEFLCDLGMKPVYVVTGTPGKAFAKRMEAALDGRVPEAKVKFGNAADMMLLHQWIKQESVDLLIGGTHGKYIARDENIPLVRHGFPILDRVGHQLFPTVGYKGAMRLCEQILSALMDQQDRMCSEETVELVM
ncbi:MAG: nitrogenase molybdenum-iron protein subunit beta [Planctomycetota bacterium]|nr:MAG: nitrogenase molybdenum-iron protein subunit beta [Planctomycetota bacterium]